jgi:hypothetical protein
MCLLFMSALLHKLDLTLKTIKATIAVKYNNILKLR